jgi:MSHA biogenesis protein MshQ
MMSHRQNLRYLVLTCFLMIVVLMPETVFASRSINSVMLNGATSVAVEPSMTINAEINVSVSGNRAGNRWRSTYWSTGSESGCVDHSNYSNETISETFTVTAPSTIGTYDFEVIVYGTNSCSGNSTTETLTNAIVVSKETDDQDSSDDSAGTCSSIFSSALQNTSSAGTITFGWNGQVLNDPDNQLETANAIVFNASGDPTCGSEDCSASGTAADSVSLPTFQTTSSTNVVNLAYGYGSYSLSTDSYNQLTTNGNGTVIRDDGAFSSYYISEMSLGYQDELVLQGGHDYWIETLNLATENVISVEGSGTARLFIGSDVSFTWATEINTAGSVDNLLIVAYGNVDYGIQDTETKFLLYSDGDVDMANQAYLNGAVAAAGDIVLESSNTTVAYSASGVTNIDGGAFCSDDEAELTCFSDDFDRDDLGSIWGVSSSSGSFGNPSIVDGRLRLTDGTNNASTVAYLLKLFPGQSNKIVYEFNLYAYSGSGADGMTVVLSDAEVTPSPGGYGGSLGYAQRYNNDGFAGGWLGLGLDEFGNFANDNEGRGDGGSPTGRILDSITVRGSGSGTSGYLLHGSSANLEDETGVGIDDTSSSTPSYGHAYRVTVDHSDNEHAYVTVERDINDGNGYQEVVSTYDALAQENQAAVPTNWLISMTGSTGGATNIHEIDNLQVCATYMNPYNSIDHYRIYHDGTGLTCSPETVTVKACLDSDCSVSYAGEVSATLSATSVSSGDVWSLAQEFLSDESDNAYVRSVEAGTVTLGVVGSSSDFFADETTRCYVGTQEQSDCSMVFYDSGFIFDVPDHVSATTQNVTLSAVRTDVTTQQCVPGFADVTRELIFGFDYSNPSSGTLPLVVNNTEVSSAGVGIALDFDSSGETELELSYADVGDLSMVANYSGSVANEDAGLSMVGNDTFIVRPDHFSLTVPGNPGASSAAGEVFVRAGADFNIEVSSRNADGDVTPNYGQEDTPESVSLTATLVAPSGQHNPVLSGSFDVFAIDCDGASKEGYACGSFSWSEVGIISLMPQIEDGSYLGSDNVIGASSGNVGRFIPDRFSVSGNSPSFSDSCSSGALPFTYMGQPFTYLIDPLMTLTALATDGETTQNYGNSFWKYNNSLAARDYAHSPESDGLTVSINSLGNVSLDGDDDYDGLGRASLTDEWLAYIKPATAVEPFTTNIDLVIAASDLADSDGVCYDAGDDGICDSFTFTNIGDNEQRYGRLRIQNVYGPETLDLEVPILTEYYSQGGYIQNSDDSCTALDSSLLLLSNYSGNLADGETSVSGSGVLTMGVSTALSLLAPGLGNDGSVVLEYDLDATPWLTLDGVNPTGNATFGIYKGNPRLIYMRESVW